MIGPDLSGRTVRGITVLGPHGVDQNRNCVCPCCSDTFFPTTNNLRRNQTGSCGCARRRHREQEQDGRFQRRHASPRAAVAGGKS